MVDETRSYAVLSAPQESASHLQSELLPFGRAVEIRDDFDKIGFADFPIDAREPEPEYPIGWTRSAAVPSPSRDMFVMQFTTFPKQAWLDSLPAAGGALIATIPENAWLVMMSQEAAQAFASRLPVQLLRLHQPIHRISPEARAATSELVRAAVSIANVPEGAEAVAFLKGNAVREINGADALGTQTVYHMVVPTAILQPLAQFPAAVWIELIHEGHFSGERDAHLVAGDTLVTGTGSGQTLKAAVGDYRSWLNDPAKNISNYNTLLKIADFNAGFDKGSSSDVHPDFLSSSGSSFVTVLDYTVTHNGVNGDCYGHGTLTAGALGGNAGAPHSTSTLDVGGLSIYGDHNFLMGLGVAPGIPIIAARIGNSICPTGTNCPPFFDNRNWTYIYNNLWSAHGVYITNNSWNSDDLTYNTDAETLDKVVRHSNGCDAPGVPPTDPDGNPCTVTGSPIVIYCSAGNNEGTGYSYQAVTAPATAKNVCSVGAAETFNPITTGALPDHYPVPNLQPPATNGGFSSNGRDIWDNSKFGPTQDGRRKPDLVAPGTAFEGPRTRYALVPPATCEQGSIGATIDSPAQHYWSRGTSFASPAAAAAGALLTTWFRNRYGNVDPSPALLKAMQINLAMDLQGGASHFGTLGHRPDNYQGWGKVDLTNAFKSDGRYAWNDQAAVLTQASPTWISGAYTVKDTSKPVTVTLVWTDAPGDSLHESHELKNDLDLIVTGTNNRYCGGNNFTASTGRSTVLVVGGTQPTYDRKNNVEEVQFLSTDIGSTFHVEIDVASLAGDAFHVWSSPVTFQQDFAVFISNVVGN